MKKTHSFDYRCTIDNNFLDLLHLSSTFKRKIIKNIDIVLLSRVHRFPNRWRERGQIRKHPTTKLVLIFTSNCLVFIHGLTNPRKKPSDASTSLRTKRVINKSSFGLHVSHRRNITISGCDLSKQGFPFTIHEISRARTPRRRTAEIPTRLLREYTEICLSRLMRMHALLPHRVDREERRSRISSLSRVYTSIRGIGVNIFTLPLNEIKLCDNPY